MSVNPTPSNEVERATLADLESVCNDIYDRWDEDQRSGKLLSALSGHLKNYDPRVTRIRATLSNSPTTPSDNEVERECVHEYWRSAEQYERGECFIKPPCVKCAAPNSPTTQEGGEVERGHQWNKGRPGYGIQCTRCGVIYSSLNERESCLAIASLPNDGRMREALERLSRHVCFSAYSASEPLTIRFDFACADDRIAAADALDDAFAALDAPVSVGGVEK